MAHDPDAAGDPDPLAGPPVRTRTDRGAAVRSVETTPDALYRWQIALLRARLDAQRSRAERAERDRQHVIDRYENLLDNRPPADELYTDGGRPATPDEGRPTTSGDGLAESSTAERALERVRSLF
jgi:hypothetical protein